MLLKEVLADTDFNESGCGAWIDGTSLLNPSLYLTDPSSADIFSNQKRLLLPINRTMFGRRSDGRSGTPQGLKLDEKLFPSVTRHKEQASEAA
jgi:hypothetical protein